MKLRIASDIHTEFFGEDEIGIWSEIILPPLDDDKNTVLILAGDIGSMKHKECLVNFLDAVVPRFKTVLYIPGNHEYYGGNLLTTPDVIRELTGKHKNLFFTNMGGCVEENKKIHMHTLWTDFDGGNPQSMFEAGERMNDYRLIRNGGRLLQPADTYNLHKAHIENLQGNLSSGDIVVSHHSPSLRSIPPEYLTDRVNGAYHSNLHDLISDKKPALWVHGHTHTACDYMQDETRIICNPRGYGNQYKKNGYRPTLVVEI